MKPVLDPRRGDIEDDASSTKRRSLLSLAGSLLSEVSLLKLALSFVLLLALPALVLGLSPLLTSAWISKVSGKIVSPLTGLWPIVVLCMLLAVGWFTGGALFRVVERSFWALNSLVVEPCYAVGRETLQHLAEQVHPPKNSAQRRKLRAIAAILAGLVICGLAVLALLLAWPSSRWVGTISDLAAAQRLAPAALANSVVLLALYLAANALVWAIADATMSQPRDFHDFQAGTHQGRTWRVAHLSDLHVVGERYGFRIESGRSGPSGNERLRRVLAQLDEIHRTNPLDVVLVSGDMTDAGRSGEWAELLDALALYPRLLERVLMLPGNHDLNVVDRANPARLDLPIGPSKRLRQMRALSVLAALQGGRVRVVDRSGGHLGATLTAVVEPYRARIAEFADSGRLVLSPPLAELWAEIFPMVVAPEPEDGLGIILLNSNAETHFSFTNALGLISAEQIRGIEVVTAQYPRASWLIALHHHPVEYPLPAKALSERIGTALINGSWFARRLRPLAGRVVLMHGHRHIDWIGECAGLLIVSAPSPVMNATDDLASYFYIHTLATGARGRLRLLTPQRVTSAGEVRADE
ncbi:MAG: metallophosphoesterase family protein [Xanthobacteraceae bacterium]